MTIPSTPSFSSPRKSGHVTKKQGREPANKRISPEKLLITDPELVIDRSPGLLGDRKIQSKSDRASLERAVEKALAELPELASSTRWHPALKQKDLKEIGDICQKTRERTKPLKMDTIAKCEQFQGCKWSKDTPSKAIIGEYIHNLEIIMEVIAESKAANCEELSLLVAGHLMSHDIKGVCIADLVGNGSRQVTPDHSLVLVGLKPEDVDLEQKAHLSNLPDDVLVVDRWLGITCSPKEYFSKRKEVMELWEQQNMPVLVFYASGTSSYVSPLSKSNELPEDSIFNLIPMSLDCYSISSDEAKSLMK